MRIPLSLFFLWGSILCCSGCASNKQPQAPGEFKFTAAPAPEWDSVFKRNHGWFGGDGLFSISLNGLEKKQTGKNDSVLIWFSDTMIGEISDSLLPGEKMINNSFALLSANAFDSSSIRFYWNKDTAANPS